jgi:hypothetical protein
LYDEDNDNEISVQELANLHSSLGEPITLEESEKMMKSIDTSKTNTFSLEEFISWWVKTHKGTKASKFRQTTFKFASGEVDKFDLKNLSIESTGEPGTLKSRIFYYYQSENGKKQQISPW